MPCKHLIKKNNLTPYRKNPKQAKYKTCLGSFILSKGSDIHSLYKVLILVRSDEFVTLSVDVDDFYLVVVLKMLAQLGDINIH